MRRIDAFIESLQNSPEGLFNPWYQTDRDHDNSEGAPLIRREQLRHYLQERVGRAKTLLIAEALGYQGGHFSGIAMTSERILLGHQGKSYGILPEDVFKGCLPQRTSRSDLNEKGMSEPTATIVWGAIKGLGLNPYEIVLWNALPWHPYKHSIGMLSNRTPSPDEMEMGREHLRCFIELFEDARIIAVGKKCEESLKGLDMDCISVRHPANGGAPRFRQQMAEIHLS